MNGRATLTAGAVVVSVLVVSACGGSGKSPAVQSVSVSASAASTSAAGTPSSSPAHASTTTPPTSPSTSSASVVRSSAPTTSTIAYVSGSTQKVCTLTGTPNQADLDKTATATGFGLQAADRGYSFTYNDDVWYIFGDSQPTKDFPVGSATRNAATRYPKDASGLDNDSMAYAAPTQPPTPGSVSLSTTQTAPRRTTGTPVATTARTS